MRKIKRYLPYIIIFLVAVLTWHRLLSIVPTGEGYYYFASNNNIDFRYLTFPAILHMYDFFAQLLFTVLIHVFKDNLSLYIYLQFSIMILTYIVFYWVLNKIFKDKWMALLSTTFFIANYIGQFTMMGGGDYQRFVQRVPQVTPVFISFLFLLYFMRNGKMKHLIFSFFLYSIPLILLHYTSFFLPLFVIFPLVYSLIHRKINIKKTFIPIILFTAATLIIIKTDSLSRPKYSLLKFALETPHLDQMVAYQISETGISTDLIVFLADHSKPQIRDPYTQILTPIFILVLIYLYFGFLRIRKDREALSIYLTIIFSVFAVAFLIMYAYDKIPNPLTNFGEDRIYFVHTILFAVIWGIMVKFIFGNYKKRTYKLICILIATVFLLQNLPRIWTGMNDVVFHSEVIKKYLAYVKTISSDFNKNSVLISPWEPLAVAPVINDFYNLSPNNIIIYNSNWEKNLATITKDKKNVFIVDFKYSTDADGNPDPKSIKIIDLTNNFRKTGKIKNED